MQPDDADRAAPEEQTNPRPDDPVETTVERRPPEGGLIAAPPPVAFAPPPSGRGMSGIPRVRVAGGKPVLLAAPIVIGRAPGRPRMAGRVIRVAVSSPLLLVSASHLEVRRVGDVVVLRDLRSTNGTIVRVPEHPPVVLSRGESLAVPIGAVADLGEGIVVEVLGPPESPDS